MEIDEVKDREEFYSYITRDMYRTIKKMDRKTLADYLYTLYKSIFSDYEKGLEASSQSVTPDYEKIRSGILQINGIGTARADKIIEVVKECLEKKEGSE